MLCGKAVVFCYAACEYHIDICGLQDTQQFYASMLLMQHFAAFLLHKQQNRPTLLIEEGANAWYYVITARETNKKQKEEKTMGVIAVLGIWAAATAGTYLLLSHI